MKKINVIELHQTTIIINKFNNKTYLYLIKIMTKKKLTKKKNLDLVRI
jgi:hypothetical protein